MKTASKSYQEYFEQSQRRWEAMCRRCGGCCGAYDDPCRHLRKDAEGLFYCTIYSQRLGERISIKGEKFDCVPVKDILHTHWKNDHLCAYKRYLRTPWLVIER